VVVILTNNCESLRYKVRALYGLIDTNGNRLDQARSLFLTLPIRAPTGQEIIASDGHGTRRALSWRGSAGSSPSQAGHVSGSRTTGIRLCSSAHSSFGVIVMVAKLRTLSPAGERQFSHSPARAMRPRSASALA
jgi:hypothetical protein